MAKSEFKEKVTLERFHSVKIMTLAELTQSLDCSRRTAQRCLVKWSCLTSYNRNSSYYTLPSAVSFNEYGIWHFNDTGFSRYGNLTETVVGLIHDSVSGLTAGELGAILKMNAHSFISRFAGHKSVRREKVGNSYVYLSGDTQTGNGQLNIRWKRYQQLEGITDSDAIIVLVEMIKHPEFDIDTLRRHIASRVPRVSYIMLESFLAKHDLLKKTLE